MIVAQPESTSVLIREMRLSSCDWFSSKRSHARMQGRPLVAFDHVVQERIQLCRETLLNGCLRFSGHVSSQYILCVSSIGSAWNLSSRSFGVWKTIWCCRDKVFAAIQHACPATRLTKFQLSTNPSRLCLSSYTSCVYRFPSVFSLVPFF